MAKTEEWRLRIDKWIRLYAEKRTIYQTILDYYNNEFDPGLLSVNLIFSYGRAMVPQLYFKNPVVKVNIYRPEEQLKVTAMTVQRMDDSLIRATGVKDQVKKMIINAYCFGRGVGKVGFQEAEGEEIGFSGMQPQLESVPLWRLRERFQPNMPWFASFYPDDFAFDADVSDLEDSSWQAMRFERSREQLIRSPELKRALRGRTEGDPDEMFPFWEIWDKHTGQWFIANFDQDVFSTDERDIEVWPFHCLDFNWMPRNPIPVSDAELILLLQNEYNEIKTQIHEHRRTTIIKLLARKGALDTEAKHKLQSGRVGPLVEVDALPAEAVMEFKPSIPMDLYTTGNTVLSDVRDAIGFTRNQLGEFSGGESSRTAREATIVQQAIQLRLDERRDMVADLIGQIIVDFNDYAASKWDGVQVQKFAGTAVGWEMFPVVVKDHVVNIVPDSTLPTSRMVQQQEAKEMYMTLRQDPMIDQIKLRLLYLNAFETGGPELLNPMAAMQMQQPQQPQQPTQPETGDGSTTPRGPQKVPSGAPPG